MSTGEMLSVANIQEIFDFEDPAAAYGVPKGTPTGKLIAIDSDTIKSSRALEQNREMYGRRTRQSKVPGNKDVGGAIGHKANWDTLPFFLKALLGSITSVTNAGSGATGTATASGGGVASVAVGAGGTLYVTPPRVSFSGGGGGSGATAYAVLTADAVTSIVVTKAGTGYTSAPTVTLSANTTHTFDVGSSLPSFLIDRKKPFSTPQYDRFKGLRVNSWTIKIASSGYYQITLDVKGSDAATTGTAYDGSAVDLTGTKKIHHGLLPPAAVLIDGVASAEFADIEIKGNNNLDTGDYPVGSQGARGGLVPDDAEIMISGTLRVISQATLDKIKDLGDHSVSFTWTDTDTSYWHSIVLPTVQFDPTDAAPDARGTFKMPFNAEAHEDGSQKQLTAKVSNARAAAFYA